MADEKEILAELDEVLLEDEKPREPTQIEEKPIEKPIDEQAQHAIISKEVDAELAEQLQKVDSHNARVEILLIAILKQLKSGERT